MPTNTGFEGIHSTYPFQGLEWVRDRFLIVICTKVLFCNHVKLCPTCSQGVASKICLDWRWPQEQSNVLKTGWCKHISKNRWILWTSVGFTWAYQQYINVHYPTNVKCTPLLFWMFFTTMRLPSTRHSSPHMTTWSAWRFVFTSVMHAHLTLGVTMLPMQLPQETCTFKEPAKEHTYCSKQGSWSCRCLHV